MNSVPDCLHVEGIVVLLNWEHIVARSSGLVREAGNSLFLCEILNFFHLSSRYFPNKKKIDIVF